MSEATNQPQEETAVPEQPKEVTVESKSPTQSPREEVQKASTFFKHDTPPPPEELQKDSSISRWGCTKGSGNPRGNTLGAICSNTLFCSFRYTMAERACLILFSE
eukprot:gb/GECG01013709.1/.p1 GENE.gb/GECG01013709.1/~~gb/GECG01013709.1/.p1  ORF type:complete len:105 (+),score=9.75 gb/GECG01013709.1/:1-315(+)